MDNKVTNSKLKSVLFYVCYTNEMCIRNFYFKDGQASYCHMFQNNCGNILVNVDQILDHGPIMYKILSCYLVFEV